MPDPSPTRAGLPAPRRQLAIMLLLVTLVLVVLDGAIANLALPSIARAFDAAPAEAVRVVSAYQLAVLLALLPCGALGERIGPRPVYLAGVALFTAASAGCALSASLGMLTVARFIQGLGGGAIMALAMMNLRHAVPPRMVGTIIGINAMVIAAASAAGPGLAGAILAIAPWPWLFALNVPIGLIVIGFGTVLAAVPGVERRIGGLAVAVNTLMFVLFFLGAESVVAAPPAALAMIAGAALCLALLLRIERGRAAPLVPTDLFADRAFRLAVMASVACFTGQMLGLVALPFLLQQGLGMPAARAGLYMMPWAAAVALIAPLAGRLADRCPTAWLCAAGAGGLGLGLAGAALLPAGPHAATLVACTVVAGLGFGLFQTPNNRVLLLSAPKARSGAAGAMQGTARLTGQTCGTILMGLFFTALPAATAPRAALCLAALCAALAAIVSLARAEAKPAD